MDYALFDSHAHPQFPQYDDDREAVLVRARDAGVGIVCVGTDLETSRQAVELAQGHEGVYAAVGLHPNDELTGEYDAEPYRLLAKQSRVVAIGEIGLDYYRTKGESEQSAQRRRFEQQLELVEKTGLPAILHCRDAYGDMKTILNGHEIRGVVHSFNGTSAQAESFLAMGYSIGLNAIVTYAHSYTEMVRSIPLERLLLETDAPFLAPEPYRGKRNEPFYTIETAKMIAETRGMRYRELARATTHNALGMFGIVEDEGL